MFAAPVTRRIIDRDGFDEYLPTACYPDRSLVCVLVGVPAGADVEEVAMSWAKAGAEEHERYFVAYKMGDRHFSLVELD